MPEPVAMVEQAVSPATEARVITVQADGSDVLRISFSGESWVEVNDGASNEIYRDLLEAGDILQITGTAPFNVLLGDAPFTELTFNGDVVDVSGNIRIDNSARLTVGL
jgi:cytoskeleton protein RodZ